MKKTFTIEVDSGDDLGNCKYIAGDDHCRPGIMIDDRRIFTRARCHAILRKLAELSEEGHDRSFHVMSDNNEYLMTPGGNYSEEYLERCLWQLRKSKYQKMSLTPEEKIKKALTFLKSQSWNDSSHLDNAIKILEGE